MIISDLNHIATVSDEAIVGGTYSKKPKFAFADAYADAYASGKYFAATFTSTYTSASTNYYGASAASESYSSSSAS